MDKLYIWLDFVSSLYFASHTRRISSPVLGVRWRGVGPKVKAPMQRRSKRGSSGGVPAESVKSLAPKGLGFDCAQSQPPAGRYRR